MGSLLRRLVLCRSLLHLDGVELGAAGGADGHLAIRVLLLCFLLGADGVAPDVEEDRHGGVEDEQDDGKADDRTARLREDARRGLVCGMEGGKGEWSGQGG